MQWTLSPFILKRLKSQRITSKKWRHFFGAAPNRIECLICTMRSSAGKPHCICNVYVMSLTFQWIANTVRLLCGAQGSLCFPHCISVNLGLIPVNVFTFFLHPSLPDYVHSSPGTSLPRIGFTVTRRWQKYACSVSISIVACRLQ